MNRNTESHFATLPEVNIGRSKFDRSFTHKTTLNTSDLVPLFCDQTIMPGDTVKMSMSSIVRQITPLTPVMDNLWMDIFFFFIPLRLVWTYFKYFMGENQSVWNQKTDYRIPKIRLKANEAEDTSHKVEKGSLLNYLGIPIGLGQPNTQDNDKCIEISQLPLRAVAKVWNDWFRDQNTQEEKWYNAGSNTTINFRSKSFVDSLGAAYEAWKLQDVAYGARCPKVNKFHDYFTSALPEPQKGGETLVPLVGKAPIITSETPNNTTSSSDKLAEKYLDKPIEFSIPSTLNQNISMSVKPDDMDPPGWYNIPEQKMFGMEVDMENAVGASVNAIRQAFAIQKFYERTARNGSRLNEMILGHFGVVNPDFRLQRSEYLGGKRIPISINQVIQSVPSESEPLGQTGAWSVTSDVSEDLFSHSFTEWGILLGFVAIRTDHTYQQGINKQWFMDKITDFYWPEFANLGEMPIYNKEIFAQDGDNISKNDEVFGYQEAWANYRYGENRISGELSSMYNQSLDIWHYGDYFSELPTLSKTFMLETKDNVKRTLAYQDGDQFKIDAFFKCTYTRPMPLYSIPGLVDHH